MNLPSSIIRSIARALRTDPEVQKMITRHPRFFRFIKNRLTPDEMFGLHLTIGISLTALFVSIAILLLRDVLKSDAVIESDVSIVNFIQLLRSPGMDATMMAATVLGKGPIVFAGMFAASLAFWITKRWHYLVGFFASVLVAELSVALIGSAIESTRPAFVNTLLHESPGRFPSGHTFIAFVFYGLLTYVLFRGFKSTLAKIVSLALGVTLTLGIGFSRMYLGIHWPADVLASFAAAAAWLTTLITILEIRRSFTTAQERLELRTTPSPYRLGIPLAVFWFIFVTISYRSFPLELSPSIPELQTTVAIGALPDALFQSLPRYSETLLGKRTEPINMVIVASEDALQNSFVKMGWSHSDPITIPNLARALKATVLNAPYLEAPGAPTFWNTRPNDFSFQKSTPQNSVRERHHVHVWRTSFKTEHEEPIWFLTAHFDVGIKLKSALIVPTHRTDPAIDKERDALRRDFEHFGLVESIREFALVEPTLGKNIVGDQFFTDGKSLLIILKSPSPQDKTLSQFEQLRQLLSTP
ncbi:MAG: LssY C-terminal domain-containing protein [Patescibacteria group bacterium]